MKPAAVEHLIFNNVLERFGPFQTGLFKRKGDLTSHLQLALQENITFLNDLVTWENDEQGSPPRIFTI